MKIRINDPYSVPTYTDTELDGMRYEDYQEEVEVTKIKGRIIALSNGKFLELAPSEYEVIS